MIEALKSIISEFIESEDMKLYLIKNAESLSKHQILDLIGYARKSFEDKYQALKTLAKFESDENSDGEQTFKSAMEEAECVMQSMTIKKDEMLLLTKWTFDEGNHSASIVFTEPYTSFKKAIQRMKELYISEEMIWHELEKYQLNNNEYEKTFEYIADNTGLIWSAEYAESVHLDFCGCSDLNLPVPFEPGDIISIDCRPYANIKNAVILQIGDNHDCCSVQCATVSSFNDEIITGALKHPYQIFEKHIEISPLYSVKICKEALQDNEKILKNISEYVNGDEIKGIALYNFLTRDNKRSVSADEILDFLSSDSILRKAYEQYIIHKDLMDRLAD